MSHEHEGNLTPAQEELASALGRLRPAPAGLNRDEVMFRAGWASARRRDRRWGAALAGLTIFLGAAAVLSHFRTPQERVVERIVYRPADARPQPPAPLLAEAPLPTAAGDADYWKLRQEVLEKGLDALPSPRGQIAHEDMHDIRAWLGGPARPAEQPSAPPGAGSIFRRWFLNGDRS